MLILTSKRRFCLVSIAVELITSENEQACLPRTDCSVAGLELFRETKRGIDWRNSMQSCQSNFKRAGFNARLSDTKREGVFQ